ncbi:hypothetical protein OAC51_08810 [Flavobacteriaceae bacterium]|nr:hypothetical protein [Flavobacteriaceae bacterium]
MALPSTSLMEYNWDAERVGKLPIGQLQVLVSWVLGWIGVEY